MTAFGTPSVLTSATLFDTKRVICTVAGPSSYNTNGSTIDLSSVLPSVAYGAAAVGVVAHANAKYKLTFVPAAAYAAATPKIKVIDTSLDPGAEVANTTDLSSITWVLEVVGK